MGVCQPTLQQQPAKTDSPASPPTVVIVTVMPETTVVPIKGLKRNSRVTSAASSSSGVSIAPDDKNIISGNKKSLEVFTLGCAV